MPIEALLNFKTHEHRSCRGYTPRKSMLRYQKIQRKKRNSWIDEVDRPKFLAALAAEQRPHREIIYFLVLSGFRITEARLLRWDMIDLKRQIVRLPDTKTGPQIREISSGSCEFIDRQAHRVGDVFSGSNGWQPFGYKQIRQVLTDICEVAGIERVTPHSLRHTAATWSAIGGASMYEMMTAYGWSSASMTEVYIERSETLGRRGADKSAAAFNVFEKPTAKVVKIK